MIKTYQIHEFAALVPMASEAEQAALNQDVLENGLRDPIVLWKNQIIDGRCRQIACEFAEEKIRFKELDDNLTEEEVRITVKSLNTRRNLTSTQKAMSACKSYLDPTTKKGSIKKTADAWGVSKGILDNALYVAKRNPEFIQPLFNGRTVKIINQNGKEVETIKITAIYSYIKKMEENAKENNEHSWNPDSYITTQLGKEWYYSKVKDIKEPETRMMIAELANYKFNKASNSDNN